MKAASGILATLLVFTGVMVVKVKNDLESFVPPVQTEAITTPTPRPTSSPTNTPKPKANSNKPQPTAVVVENKAPEQQVWCNLGQTTELRNISECSVSCSIGSNVYYYPSQESCNNAVSLYLSMKNDSIDPLNFVPPPNTTSPTVNPVDTTYTYDPLHQVHVEPTPTPQFPPIGFHN